MRSLVLALLGSLVGATSCGGGSVFSCTEDDQCDNGGIGGICQPSGCSFPDDTCDSGQRYGEHAAPEFAGQCVDLAGSESTAADPTVAPSADPSTTSGDNGEATPDGTDGASSTTGAELDPDLLLWLEFEQLPPGLAIDSGVLGLDSVCLVDECPVAVPGPVGQAAEFDGMDDALTVPIDSAFELPDGFSIAMWLRVELLVPMASHAVLGRAYGPTNLNSYLVYFRTNFDMNPDDWEVGLGLHSMMLSNFVHAAMSFEQGEWVHFAATWDGTSGRLYLGGVEVASQVLDPPLFDDHPVTIGHDINNDLAGAHFGGAIDDLRLYGRTLTEEEIAALPGL